MRGGYPIYTQKHLYIYFDFQKGKDSYKYNVEMEMENAMWISDYINCCLKKSL